MLAAYRTHFLPYDSWKNSTRRPMPVRYQILTSRRFKLLSSFCRNLRWKTRASKIHHQLLRTFWEEHCKWTNMKWIPPVERFQFDDRFPKFVLSDAVRILNFSGKNATINTQTSDCTWINSHKAWRHKACSMVCAFDTGPLTVPLLTRANPPLCSMTFDPTRSSWLDGLKAAIYVL